MSNLLDVFQSFRRILCLCPCCGEILRLSDLHLKHTGKTPKTWLDKHESKLSSLERKEQLFKEKEMAMRKKARERGRKKVPKLIRKLLSPEFKKLKFDPYDLKALMHPVDFVIFNGLNKGPEVKDVTFVNRRPSDREQKLMLQSIRETLVRADYDWRVARITVDGSVNFE
ncbi:MAG: Holliday junction resolvase-like protein [Thermoplasmata archaeon]